MPFFANLSKSKAAFCLLYGFKNRSKSLVPFLKSSSRLKYFSQPQLKCPMLFCPASEASAAVTELVTCPTNVMSCFLQSLAMAKYASHESPSRILMKSPPMSRTPVTPLATNRGKKISLLISLKNMKQM